MTELKFDLTGGEVRILGNSGDEHLFRLGNPSGETIVNDTSEYSAEFTSVLDDDPEEIELDVSDVGTGFLSLPVTIKAGTYRVRLVEPQRTLLTMLVEEAR